MTCVQTLYEFITHTLHSEKIPTRLLCDYIDTDSILLKYVYNDMCFICPRLK